jgi:hypothetical protein
LVLRLNQEIFHDFVLQFLPPCSPQLILLATGSLEPNILVFSTPGGLTSNDLSRLFFTVGVFYVVTKFATAPKSLLVYYTVIDTSARTRKPL